MKRFLIAGLLMAVAAGAPAFAAPGVSLKGQVSFTGVTSDASAPDFSDTVVFFTPDTPVKPKPQTEQTMTMLGKSFAPHVLAVSEGTTVRFPNQDEIFHNAFSLSAPNDFDLGLYDTGTGKSQVFAHPGLVHVYCNVHRDMFAYILVLDTPFFTKAKDDGSFDLTGLPAVSGQLTIYNPRTAVWKQKLATPAGTQPLAVQLAVTFNGVPEHMNKTGQPYATHHKPGGR